MVPLVDRNILVNESEMYRFRRPSSKMRFCMLWCVLFASLWYHYVLLLAFHSLAVDLCGMFPLWLRT